MTRYAMIADLDRCIGCQTCVAACRHANATSPGVQWRKVLDLESGVYPSVSRTFIPVGCQHCDDPPCMHVCPTTATRKRADGIVSVDYDLCIGCAYCDVACPYQARFKISESVFAYGKDAMRNEEVREDVRRIGVSQKCTFCSDRIDEGRAAGLVPGRDPVATPACVNSCIADALSFGDIDDPSSNVRRLLAEHAHFQMHDELGTAPKFYYLLDHHAPHAVNAAAADVGSEAGNVRNRGIEPSHQKHWDWKAANNFLFGGAGTVLFVFAVLGDFISIPFRAFGVSALVLVAVGLFGLFFKIGRPARFIYVFRQPRRSWMSREAWISVFFFTTGTLALWSGSRPLAALGAVLGLAFLCSQAMILKEAKGIPAWRLRAVIPLIVITGLCEGAGLYALGLIMVRVLLAVATPAMVTLLVLTSARGVAWGVYRHSLKRAGAPTRSLEVLGRFERWFYVAGIVVPLAFLGLAFLAPVLMQPMVASTALCLLGSGWAMKFVLVTRAGYNQGFALKRVSGSGLMLDVERPGWTACGA
jgi:Fe-S-cluster-containing dehydrogenase component/DMSO reductase anchor subunit